MTNVNNVALARESAPCVHRVNVNFTEDAYGVLRDLAERKGMTMGQVLRDAIALEVWFQDEIRAGHRILIERDGKVREVVPR